MKQVLTNIVMVITTIGFIQCANEKKSDAPLANNTIAATDTQVGIIPTENTSTTETRTVVKAPKTPTQKSRERDPRLSAQEEQKEQGSGAEIRDSKPTDTARGRAEQLQSLTTGKFSRKTA